MTTELMNRTDHYLESFRRFEKEYEEDWWPFQARREAFARFSELGFPTQHDEEWRYTSVQNIARTAFELTGAAEDDDLPDQVASLLLPDVAAVLVFVDGRFSARLSKSLELPAGAMVTSMVKTSSKVSTTLQAHLGRYADFQDHPFVALNTAFMEDGAFVHVPAGVVVPGPIQLLYLSTAQKGQPRMIHPRNLLVAETGSQASLIETYTGTNGGAFFTNAVTEVVAGDGAVVDHYKVIQESGRTSHIGTLQFHQTRDSHVGSQVVTLGGSLVRNNIGAVMAGEGADCTLAGLYVADQDQHVDNHLHVDHAKPHCNSREFFRGVLDGHARGVFSGRIVVREQAQKTDAKQTNKTLLLSKNAQVESKPQLEIFANDVKCTHGATIGRVSEEAVFYLRSRGLTEQAAKSMLVAAFARESLAAIRPAALRARLDAAVVGRLPQGHLLLESI